jgi:hypothetical protein
MLVVKAEYDAACRFVDDGKQADGIAECSAAEFGFQSEWPNDHVAYHHQNSDPAGCPAHYPSGGADGIEIEAIHDQAVAVGELGAGEYPVGIRKRSGNRPHADIPPRIPHLPSKTKGVQRGQTSPRAQEGIVHAKRDLA